MKRLGLAALVTALLALSLPASSAAAASGPVFTTPAAVTFVEGTTGRATVAIARTKTSGTTASFSWTGRLPKGLTFMSNGDGRAATLAGTPAVGSAGTYAITVTAVNPDGTRAAQPLKVTVAPIAADVPIVTSLSPNATSGTDVTISGRNLATATTVRFGTADASFKADAGGTLLRAVVPTGVTGVVDVTVSSPAGTSPITVDDRYTYNVAPQRPVIVNVRPIGFGIVVNWPPNATSDKVSSYTVTATASGAAAGAAGPAGPATNCDTPPPVTAPGTVTGAALLTGVCSGVAYTVTLTATNPWGTSAPSATSNTVVPLPLQPPTRPLIQSVRSRPHALLVNWAPPAESGGNPVTGYTLTAARNGAVAATAQLGGAADEATIGGLTDGVLYTVSLVARSPGGTSRPGTGSGKPSSTMAPVAPSGLRVVPDGGGRIVATWSPPADVGSRALAGYVLQYRTALPGKAGRPGVTGRPVSINLPASATRRTLTGLAADKYYSVSVSARSAVGTGPAIVTGQPVTPTVQVGDNTRILDAKTMAALRSQTVDSAGVGHILIWPASTTFKPPLTPGVVLIGSVAPAAPEGLLVQVQSVGTTSAGDIEVDTTPASASQAFTTMSFSTSGVPAPASSVVRATASGVRAASLAGDPTIPVNWSNDAGTFTIEGQVSFTPSVAISASVYCKKWIGKKHKLCYSWGANAATSASLQASTEVTATLQGAESIDLLDEVLTCICFAVGPIPVAIIPTIGVNLVLSGHVSVTATASISLGGGVTWDSASGFANSHYATVGSSGAPTVSATAQGTVDLVVEFALCLYGVLCGDIQAVGSLEANLYYPGPPYFSLCPSVDINVGFAINLVIWSTNNQTTLTTITPTPACYTLSAPPVLLNVSPANATVALGTNVQTFTATRSDGHVPSSTWTLQNPVTGDTISSTGQLSTCCVGGNRVLMVKDTDSAAPAPTGPGTATVIVGSAIAYGPPTQLAMTPVGATITFLGTTIHLTGTDISWAAPVNTGGAPITSYIVKGNGVTYTTTGTHLVVPASALLTWVTLQVTAVNANGVASPKAVLKRWLSVGQTGAIG